MLFGYCVVADAGYNWYLCDINIFLLSKNVTTSVLNIRCFIGLAKMPTKTTYIYVDGGRTTFICIVFVTVLIRPLFDRLKLDMELADYC